MGHAAIPVELMRRLHGLNKAMACHAGAKIGRRINQKSANSNGFVEGIRAELRALKCNHRIVKHTCWKKARVVHD